MASPTPASASPPPRPLLVFVCSPIPPWVFEDRGDAPLDGLRAWKENAWAAARPADGAELEICFAVALHARFAAQHREFFRGNGIDTVEVDDDFPYDPPLHHAPGTPYTEDQLRRLYACRATMRVRLLSRAATFEPVGRVFVWFLSHQLRPTVDDFQSAWFGLSQNPACCVVAPLPSGARSAGGTAEHGQARGVIIDLPPAHSVARSAGGAAETRAEPIIAILNDELVRVLRNRRAKDLTKVRAGTLDWAVANVATWASVPMKVGQLPVKVVWTTNSDKLETLTSVGQARGVSLAGESPAWFWGAASKNIPVYAIMGSESCWADS